MPDENPAVPADEPPEGQRNIEGENQGIARRDPPDDQRQWPEPTREPAEEPSHERSKDDPAQSRNTES